MELRAAAFNRLLGAFAQRSLWRRAVLCPCRDTHSGAADPACQLCFGRGRFHYGAVESPVALSGMKASREWQSFGLYQAGDVVVSLASNTPLYGAAEGDRVTFLDSELPWQAAFRRGDPDERLPPHTFVVEDTVALLPGGIPRALDPPANLPTGDEYARPTWAPGAAAPGDGEAYSVRARIRPTYHLFREMPQDRAHHGGARLPRRVVLRLEDLAAR